jgi:hypothetical protein
MAPNLRFATGDMHGALERQGEVVAKAVRSLDPDLVLTVPAHDLVERLYEKYRIDPIVLDLENRRSSGAKDVAIPFESWGGRTLDVDGTRVDVVIPFAGDAVLLDIRASTFTMNPPRFDVRGNTIVITYEGRAPLDPQQVKGAIDQVVGSIEQHLAWQRSDIDPWNERLLASLEGQIEARRTKVLQDRALDAFLEVPVADRPNAATSFTVDPPKRAQSVPVASASGGRSFAPEPAISENGFGDILREIASVTVAVQRLPKTFVEMPEESLRDVLLVVLNNRFGPATGETFSRRGKTDIFIPWGGDERAVFIAECKWWKGAAAFAKAIDQLLGYLTWRDTRGALILFVRGGSPTEIEAKADARMRAHSSYKRASVVDGHPVYTLARSEDTDRELHVALLVVPVLP